MTARYNVVFVGKTGTGKSALINYLYGDKIRETGVGKPVTQRGFQCVDFEINELPVRLFDSCGLEVGREKEQEWLEDLDEELKKRGTGKPAEEWFHSVFYCIAGSGHRVENFEIEVIRQFVEEKYRVAVILTKSDLISEEDEEKLRDAVKSDLGQAVPVIPVCSEEKQLRGGRISEKFGKEEVELRAYNDFWDSMILRLPEHCVKVLEQRIDEWHKKQKKYIEKNTRRWNLKKILQEIETEETSFINNEFGGFNTIIQELQHALDFYGTFSQCLDPPNTGFSVVRPLKGLASVKNRALRVLLIPAFIAAFPATCIEHLIFGAKNNKKELLEEIEQLVVWMKKKLPEIESEIKKGLENLKEE